MCILNTELTQFLNEKAMGWEEKGGIKDNTKFFDLINLVSSGQFTKKCTFMNL